MRVILLQDVPALGDTGEVREVKEGYAQHFLLPRGLAAPATTANLQTLQQNRKAAQEREARAQQRTVALRANLEALVVAVHAKAGEGGRLFGSVTGQDIAQAITRQGIEISGSGWPRWWPAGLSHSWGDRAVRTLRPNRPPRDGERGRWPLSRIGPIKLY